MENTEQKSRPVMLSDGNAQESSKKDSEDQPSSGWEQFKKPLIFALMLIIFAGSIYMIFIPSDKDVKELAGLNEMVPQAEDEALPADKKKMYEQDQLAQKEKADRSELSGLSDFFSRSGDEAEIAAESTPQENQPDAGSHQNEALKSYKNIQSNLGSFYQNDQESEQLRREVKSLRTELNARDQSADHTVNNQLALMEKSYQLASRYFPVGSSGGTSQSSYSNQDSQKVSSKPSFAQLGTSRRNVVSALYRDISDSAFIAKVSQGSRLRFSSSAREQTPEQEKNTISACIHHTQSVTAESTVTVRLLEPAMISGILFPRGSMMSAAVKFAGNRLYLIISSVEHQGMIIPVKINAFDTDGSEGLYFPLSPERNVLTDIVGNMGTTSGTNISMSSTTGQQITSDLSKSVVQGMSGYFSKKVRVQKVTLKAGHRVLLMSKK